MVTVADIIADNGVVHVIDAVLLPPVSNTIYDVVLNSQDHITLLTAIDTCGLKGTLSGLVHLLCSHQLMQHLMLYQPEQLLHCLMIFLH